MKQEYKLNTENIRPLLKSIIALENITLTKLKTLINQKFNKNDSMENLANKLRTKTLRVEELLEILDILNYQAIIRKK